MVLSLLVLVGCSDQFEYEYTVEDEGTVEGTVDGNDYHADITTEDGDVEIDVHVENEDSWCQTGTSWASTSNEGSANMMVEGIMTEGEYEGFCHIVLNTETEEESSSLEYYINEDGSEGYMVMDINGQEYTSAWSG